MKIQILLTVLSITFIGCAEVVDEINSGGNNSRGGSRWEQIPKSADNIDSPYNVQIERTYQWVNETQCDGSINRYKQTVTHPKKSLEIIPKSGRSYITDSDVYNDTTDDWRECFWNTCKKNQFDAHTSKDASQTLWVRKNRINQIEYSFRWADGEEESGVRYIFIEYSESIKKEEKDTCNCEAGC